MASSDEGYFSKGRSVLRRVHSERAVGLMYGQRALLIGAAQPVNFTGTMLSTGAIGKPWQRLVHTAKGFETIFFGTREEADKVLAFVHKLHERVSGELAEDAGRYPAGTTYSAFDADLMLWTVAVIADSAEVFYEALVRPLTHAEREGLWNDYLLFGELFGMPRDRCPATYGEFREYWNGMLGGDALHLTPQAREVGSQIAFQIPMPRHLYPARRVHNLLLLGTVPERVREMYGFGWSRAQEAAFRATVLGIRRSRPVTPRRIRRGLNTSSFDLVGRTDKRLASAGKQAMQMPVIAGRPD